MAERRRVELEYRAVGDDATRRAIEGIGNAADNSARRISAASAAATSSLARIEPAANRAIAPLQKLQVAFAGLATGALIGNVIRANTEFQKLQASLTTVTGSADNAKVAFAAIEQFAAETPYQLDEVVSAFIKLKSLGLDPSMEALKSYGNTASAMGKSLTQWIEAVADASTGEFERLKEFGIKASQEGGKVSLTFQGVTTTISKNADAIEAYLRKIGNNQFGGAMGRQMDTLGGKFSNFEDQVDRLYRQIGEGGLNSAMQELVGNVTDLGTKGESTGTVLGSVLGSAISDLDAIIKSTVTDWNNLKGIFEWVTNRNNGAAQQQTQLDAARGRLDMLKSNRPMLGFDAEHEQEIRQAEIALEKLERQVASTGETAAATVPTIDVFAKGTRNTGDEAEKAGKKVRTLKDVLEDLTGNQPQQDFKAVDDAWKLINSTIGDGATEMDRYNKLSGEVQAALRTAGEASEEAWRPTPEIIERTNRALENMNPAVKEARERQKEAAQETARYMEEQQRVAERNIGDIVDYGSTTFADMFGENRKSWSEMWDDMADTAVRTIAKLAASLILDVPVRWIYGQLAGPAGTATRAGNSGVPGATGGTFDWTQLLSGGSSGASLLNGGAFGGTAAISSFLFGNAASPSVALTGASALGPGGMLVGGGVTSSGAATSGLIGTGGTLLGSSSAANALASGISYSPWGIIGSMAGQAMGLGSGNVWADTALSTAGSIAGGALGAAAVGTGTGIAAGAGAGVAGGAAAGAAAGSIVPIIGTVVGAPALRIKATLFPERKAA